MEEPRKESLILDYMGDDDSSMPVYQDQYGNFWKDVGLGGQEEPCLYSVSGNAIDGDPDVPVSQEFIIRTKKVFVSEEKRFQYQMLDRLRSDCEYYLGYGHRNTRCLWAGSEEGQIEEMKKIWNSFSDAEKPEWLAWKQIEKYERDMVIQKRLKPGARFMGDVSKTEMEIVKIKGAASGTNNEPPSPTALLRDTATGREFSRSLDALKCCGIVITKEPVLSEAEGSGSICNSLMCALLCHQTVTLNLTDGSSIQGNVGSVATGAAAVMEDGNLRHVVTVPYGKVKSMFIS